jgi:hypothetical protein
MSKPLRISVALAALLVTAAPAVAQRHPGPSKLRDADHSPPTAVTVHITVPALIRARAQPDRPPTSGDDNATKVSAGATLQAREPQPDNAAGPHVKVFDGATLRGEPQPDGAAAPHVKAFDGATLRAGEPQPDGAAAPHVKAFDGATLRAGEPQPNEAAKPILSVRKAGEPPESSPQPDGEESAAARMQTQNNLKQIGLGAH